jgi:hypothetical protein
LRPAVMPAARKPAGAVRPPAMGCQAEADDNAAFTGRQNGCAHLPVPPDRLGREPAVSPFPSLSR